MSYQYQGYVEEHEETGSRKTGLVIGLGMLIVVAVVLVLVYRATRPQLVPAPTSYASFADADSTFKVDQPVGWTVTGGESQGVESLATFEKGSAKITVDSSLGGSLMGDMAAAQNAQMENLADNAGVPEPPPVPPVERVHEEGQQGMAAKYADYAEMPMQDLPAKLADGRYSEFTANGGTFVGPLHGYRATLLSNERAIDVVTVCPERNWSILQPAFMHILLSVSHPGQ